MSHEGQPIYLEENAIWTALDVDYTPYNNIISAVWPQLRYVRKRIECVKWHSTIYHD